MKYICIINFGNQQEIFVFPKTINHAYMADLLHCPVISAGFVSIANMCFGESLTLDLKSRGQIDTDILAKQFLV